MGTVTPIQPTMTTKPPYMFWEKGKDCDSGHDAVDGWIAVIRTTRGDRRLCRVCEGIILNTLLNQYLLRKINAKDRIVLGFTGPLRKSTSLIFAMKKAEALKGKSANA